MGLQSARTLEFGPGRRAARLAIAGGVAAATGAVAAAVRPLFGPLTGAFHPEAAASVFVILPAISLTLVLTRRHMRWTRQATAMLLELVVVPMAFIAGWSLVEGRVWSDLVGVMLVYWLASSFCAVALLAVLQRLRPIRRDGFCPSCDYCLAGAVHSNCPECGRPLTAAEIGIGGAQRVSLAASGGVRSVPYELPRGGE